VYQSKEDLSISQRMYVEIFLRKFKKVGCEPMVTPFVVNEKLKKEDGEKKMDAWCTNLMYSQTHELLAVKCSASARSNP
jgi:hypothetical protein